MNINMDIEYVEQNKDLFCEIFNKDEYTYDVHIANGVYYSFFYLEFYHNISYFEMVSCFLKENLKFHNENFFYKNEKEFFNPRILSSISNDKDIQRMESLFNGVIDMIKSHENSWCSMSNKSEDDNNDDIVGYYLNDIWQSNTFPSHLKDKIYSANNYITLINEGSEVMIVMEHGAKQSLFYSMNDQ